MCIVVFGRDLGELDTVRVLFQLSLHQGEDLTITDASTPNWLRVDISRVDLIMKQFMFINFA